MGVPRVDFNPQSGVNFRNLIRFQPSASDTNARVFSAIQGQLNFVAGRLNQVAQFRAAERSLQEGREAGLSDEFDINGLPKGDSITARRFREGALETFVTRLEKDRDNKLSELSLEFLEDPEGFRKAAVDATGLMSSGLPPEVKSVFDLTSSKTINNFYTQGRVQAFRQQKHMIAQEQKDTVSHLMGLIDRDKEPANAAQQDVLDQNLVKLQATLTSMVDKQNLTEEGSQIQMQIAQDLVQEGQILSQVRESYFGNGMKDARAFVDDLRKRKGPLFKKGAGSLKNVSDSRVRKLAAQGQRMIDEFESNRVKKKDLFSKAIMAERDLIGKGFDRSAQIEEKRQEALSTGDMESFDTLTVLSGVNGFMTAFRGMSANTQEFEIAELNEQIAGMKNPPKDLRDMLDSAQTFTKQVRTALKDGTALQLFETAKLIPESGVVDFGKPEALQQVLALRRQGVEWIDERYGQTVPLIKKEEVEALEEIWESSDRDGKGKVITLFNDLAKAGAITSREVADIMAQTSKRGSVLTSAVMFSGDDPSVTSDLLLGLSKIQEKNLVPPEGRFFADRFAALTKDYQFPPEVASQYMDAARVLYINRISRENPGTGDFSVDTVDERVYREELERVMGPSIRLEHVFSFSKQPVLSFRKANGQWATQDEFRDSVEALSKSQELMILTSGSLMHTAEGKLIDNPHLMDMDLVKRGRGKYSVLLDGKDVFTPMGNRFILNMGRAIEENVVQKQEADFFGFSVHPTATIDDARDAVERASVSLARPVEGRVTSEFSGNRKNPVTGRFAPHEGTDYAAAMGAPIKAARAGTIKFVGVAGAHGKRVVIDHGDGLETSYSHMNAFKVEKGQVITAGAPIGTVGQTGRATGPHLHFEIRKNGSLIDPEKMLRG